MTLAEALSWVSEIVNEPPVRVRPDTKRIDLAGWDSLGQLLLMSALDQQFGIKLTQDEFERLHRRLVAHAAARATERKAS